MESERKVGIAALIGSPEEIGIGTNGFVDGLELGAVAEFSEKVLLCFG